MPNNTVQVPCDLWQEIAECLQVYATLFPPCNVVTSPLEDSTIYNLSESQRKTMLDIVSVQTDKVIDAMFAIGV